jgi:hypothetical protein
MKPVINMAAPTAAPTTPPITAAGGPVLVLLPTDSMLATNDGVTYTVGITVVTNTTSPSAIVDVRVTGMLLEMVRKDVLKWVETVAGDCVIPCVVIVVKLVMVDDGVESAVGVLLAGSMDVVLWATLDVSVVLMSGGVVVVGTGVVVVGTGVVVTGSDLVVGGTELLVVVIISVVVVDILLVVITSLVVVDVSVALKVVDGVAMVVSVVIA